MKAIMNIKNLATIEDIDNFINIMKALVLAIIILKTTRDIIGAEYGVKS